MKVMHNKEEDDQKEIKEAKSKLLHLAGMMQYEDDYDDLEANRGGKKK
jgi:hypothetical protein